MIVHPFPVSQLILVVTLQNSMEASLPVRVVRGHGSASSYCGKVYTYDGLYKVNMGHIF